MKYIVKRIHNCNGEMKILNPTQTITILGALDAKVVSNLEDAHLFDDRDSALEFLETTTFFDKGYSAFPVDFIDGELKITSSKFGVDY